MEFLRLLFGMKKAKPVKVQDAFRQARCGIVASSLEDLKKKAASRLKLKGPVSVVLEEDGTSIDSEEYFQSLSPQTAVVILTPTQSWDGYITYLKLAMEKVSANIMAGNQTIQEIQEIFQSGDQSPELSLLVEYVNSLQANVAAEKRDEDPMWFEGLQKTFDTKDKVMRHAAKTRIRGYLSKIKESITKLTICPDHKVVLEEISDHFHSELQAAKFHSSYFSRTARERDRLCTAKGWFYCEGPYNAEGCVAAHVINPYGTRDSRVLFSTWNLDHRIEKNREILPRLVDAVVNCPRHRQVNWKYFYQVLFTKLNLSIVEIRCHMKERHDGMVIDESKIYIKT